MKRLAQPLLALLLAVVLAPAAAAAQPAHVDLAAMDRTVDPCVDFYDYACAGWIRQNPIPGDQPAWAVYYKLFDDNATLLRQVLEAAAKPDPRRTPVERQIGDYYAACMDQAAIDKAGLAPIRKDLEAIAAVSSLDALADEVAALHSELSVNALFRLSSEQDFKDSTQIIGSLAQGGLGLPDRDYYLNDDAKSVEIRRRYAAYLETMFGLLGDAAAAARDNAAAVVAIETALAKGSLTQVERRDPTRLYHPMKTEELVALAPSFPWRRYFAHVGLPGLAGLDVEAPDFFRGLDRVVKTESLEHLKTYLRSRLATAAAPSLATPFEAARFDFYNRTLRGQQQPLPRWKLCTFSVDASLGEALGQAYVARAFSPELKARVETMVRGIETAMEEDIRSLDWMSQPTKEQALQKLGAVRNKIGYPDRWRDYGSIRIARDDYAGDLRRATQFEKRRDLAKIGKPLDRGEWEMTPPTVNAYYNAGLNEINFPAGILQPPFFEPRRDDAQNYGRIGATIGHELTHGFDDEGRRFDAAGNLRDWWTEADGKEFEKRAACLVDQYSRYVAVADVKVNGQLTLGENVADLGGVMLAWRAWKAASGGQKPETIDGFTPEQRFFLGYGQGWCAAVRPEEMRRLTATNPHAPDRYRANGVLSNLPEFRQAFSCKVGQPMAPEKTCRIW